MKEIWKDIKGYEGVYAISNYGHVYSYYTEELIKSHDAFDKKNKPFRLRVKLTLGSKKNMKMVHRLVYETFIGEVKNQLDFKDGNFRNVRLDNLIEVDYTHKEKIYKNKRVIDTSTMKVYESMKSLCDHLKIKQSTLRKGMKRKSGKYIHYKLI